MPYEWSSMNIPYGRNTGNIEISTFDPIFLYLLIYLCSGEVFSLEIMEGIRVNGGIWSDMPTDRLPLRKLIGEYIIN